MSDVVVVDASLAVKWILVEEDSAIAKILLKKWADEGKVVVAPALFAYEVTNIIYRQVVLKKLTYDEANQGLIKLFSIGVLLKFASYEAVSTQAMELAHMFDLSASYDAHYLTLAKHEDAECWTADKRLWNSVKGKLQWVHLIEEIYH